MLSYCLKFRKNIKSKNPEVSIWKFAIFCLVQVVHSIPNSNTRSFLSFLLTIDLSLANILMGHHSSCGRFG